MLAEVDQRHVISEDVRFTNGSNGFLAQPDAPGPHPTVVLLHERYGLVQHNRDLATRFAAEGNVCLAPNLFFRADNQEALATGEANYALDDDTVVADVGVVVDYLRQHVPAADLSKLAMMGVCATGRHPLVIAAHREDVAACVVFYGGAYKREWVPEDTLSHYIQRSKAPVLGVFGELDHLISVEDVRRFRNALENANRSYQIKMFPNAPHGYLNDTMPGRYVRPQAESAWQTLSDFLRRVHAGGYPADRVKVSFEIDHAVTYDFAKNVRLE
jgi:carboxymethylenebutenolidase